VITNNPATTFGSQLKEGCMKVPNGFKEARAVNRQLTRDLPGRGAHRGSLLRS
jgi:hypothetical protein